jgi:hypothetical protein
MARPISRSVFGRPCRRFPANAPQGWVQWQDVAMAIRQSPASALVVSQWSSCTIGSRPKRPIQRWPPRDHRRQEPHPLRGRRSHHPHPRGRCRRQHHRGRDLRPAVSPHAPAPPQDRTPVQAPSMMQEPSANPKTKRRISTRPALPNWRISLRTTCASPKCRKRMLRIPRPSWLRLKVFARPDDEKVFKSRSP